MNDKLRDLLQEQFTELANANVDGIAGELQNNPECKLTVSSSYRLTLAGQKLYSTASISYSRKFSDTVESGVEIGDPKQLTMTMKVGDGPEVTVDDKAARLLKRAASKMEKGA